MTLCGIIFPEPLHCLLNACRGLVVQKMTLKDGIEEEEMEATALPLSPVVRMQGRFHGQGSGLEASSPSIREAPTTQLDKCSNRSPWVDE